MVVKCRLKNSGYEGSVVYSKADTIEVTYSYSAESGSNLRPGISYSG